MRGESVAMNEITVTRADGETLTIPDTPQKREWAAGKGYHPADADTADATPPPGDDPVDTSGFEEL